MNSRQEWFVDCFELENPLEVRIGNGKTNLSLGRGNIKILALNDVD